MLISMISRQHLEHNKLSTARQTDGWNSPHGWLVKLPIDLAKGGAQNLS